MHLYDATDKNLNQGTFLLDYTYSTVYYVPVQGLEYMAVVVIHTEVLSPHPYKKIKFKLYNTLKNITAYVRYKRIAPNLHRLHSSDARVVMTRRETQLLLLVGETL